MVAVTKQGDQSDRKALCKERPAQGSMRLYYNVLAESVLCHIFPQIVGKELTKQMLVHKL